MSKRLVSYFSASGVTAKLAKTLAAAIGADLFEILPEKPYSAADLDWTNKESRSTIEMNDKSFRPAVANRVENMAEYDAVYVGFPEQHDLTGKTIVPFATSGGSGMGNTNAELAPSCKGAMLKEGKRFSSSTKEAELKLWAEKAER